MFLTMNQENLNCFQGWTPTMTPSLLAPNQKRPMLSPLQMLQMYRSVIRCYWEIWAGVDPGERRGDICERKHSQECRIP
jgi:hypothetical protein